MRDFTDKLNTRSRLCLRLFGLGLGTELRARALVVLVIGTRDVRLIRLNEFENC